MSARSAPVVITGAGLVTSLGLTRHSTWQAVLAGRCGMGTMPAMECSLPPDRDGGQAPDLPADFEPAKPREVRYLRRAILDALQDAGIAAALPYPSHRCGLMLGTTLHGMRSAGEFLRRNNCEPLRDFLAPSVLRSAAADLGMHGLAATTCSACSSSLGSIALALTLLHSGELDLVVAGGYDPISEYAYAGFNSLRLVAQGPLRPFAKDREGMKLAEGYGIVVLERGTDAQRRNAVMLAAIQACGESSDAHHLTQPHPHGEGAARAMASALRAADLTINDIDLIVAHATGTPDNDAGEYAALQRTFGERLAQIPVVAFKSHLGHTLGGAGAVELILAAMSLREQMVPPCATVCQGSVEFADLQLASGSARPTRIRATLSTSLGFGGANTCAILTAPPTRAVSPEVHVARRDARREVLITGVGVIFPGAVGNTAFVERLENPSGIEQDAGAVPDEAIAHLVQARRSRRMSEYVKLVLAATTLASQDAQLGNLPAFADCSVLLGTTHGSSNYSDSYYRQIVTEGIGSANPMLFAEGVPNAGSAHISLMLGVRGSAQTLIGSRTAGLDALRLAALRIATGEWNQAIVGAAEEYSFVTNQAYEHCGLYGGPHPATPPAGFLASAGAAVLILESRTSADQRGVAARGIIQGGASRAWGPHHGVDAMSAVLAALQRPHLVLSSANGTWIDRVESAAIRRMRRRDADGPCIVGAMYGHVGESFSVLPLASIAGTLLRGRLPSLLTGTMDADQDLQIACGQEQAKSFTVICTDYTGLASGVRIEQAASDRHP